MGGRLAQCPGGTLPQAFPDWKDLKAAYRFINQPKVTCEHIQAPHWAKSRAGCRQPGEYLIIEDTMLLDYTGHPAAGQLGVIGNGRGRGFHVHSSLAARVEGWTAEQRPQVVLQGLVAQQCYCPQPAPDGEKRSQRYHRGRQSQRWAIELLAAMGKPPPGCRWVYVADREADFYEPIWHCLQQGWDFVIRSSHDRRLEGEAQHLRAVIAQAPVQGMMLVELRARPGQRARTAMVAVRSRSVELSGPWRPGGWQPGLEVNVLEVSEINPPADVEPLHWILLTSLPCCTWREVQQVVGRYAARWLIEEYHKAVQSGTKVEESQLEEGSGLETLIAVLAVVAVRLLNTKLLARAKPDDPILAGEFGPEALAILEAQYGKPEAGWTNLSVLVAIARMGGFLARKHDGMPGWQTIWRGWQRLMTMCQGLDILNHAKQRYG